MACVIITFIDKNGVPLSSNKKIRLDAESEWRGK